ncbi:hypothetical protein CMV_014957 [Castanea mollissima]|uniref:Uncharacterized protein n=1 Tax=Castanea mollissima TaxID=60419 RepID=A0A8J4QWA9_9ROSI|nr:hypothetical protein CMV_014957 [Castanea mollissima]
MAESKPDQTTHFLSDEVKAPNLFERAKEEIEAILHSEKSPQHYEETHGKRNDIDENTPLDAVRAPNVFERAKEELEALVQTIHPKKDSPTHERREETTKTESKQDEADSLSENNIQGPNFIEKAKEKIEAITPHHKSSHYHHKETHGTSDDIDEKTPIYDVKGPNVFHRAKEEIEAVIETIHPKKDHTSSVSSPKKEGGFRFFIGRMLEKVCSPQGSKRD